MKRQFYIIGLCALISLGIVFFSWKGYEEYYHFSFLYEQGEYSEILDNFENQQSPEMLHNLGNTALAEFTGSGSFSDLSLLESAVIYYSGSLNISEHEDTRYNYNLSKELLDIFSQQQEEQNQQGSEEGGENNSQRESDEAQNPEDGEGDKQEDQQNQTNPIQNSRSDQYRLSEDEVLSQLSEEEEKQLEEAIENLKQEQVLNQNFYGKKEQTSDFQDIFESFFGSIDRGGEKDW